MKRRSNHKKYFSHCPVIFSCFFLVIVATIIFTLGCEELSQIDNTAEITPEEEITSIESEPDNTVEPEEEGKPEEDPAVTTESGEEETEKPEEHSMDIEVYYVDEQAQYLVGEERTIIGTYKEDFINNAFKELLKEPEAENIYNIIPLGTDIINSEFVDNIAFLNLTPEFVDNKWEDGLIDMLVVNCIAATITEIPDVEGILINIDNERLEKYGSLDISAPVRRNTDLIKE